VFSDELNHASIVDGCRLAARAGARVRTFRHSDMGHLKELLAASESSSSRKLIVSDTLFSMDGDWAHVGQLRRLADQHGALLVLDDAHATLVSPGEHQGAGAHIHVGTLSKAVGALGGFVACSTPVKVLLISKARGQVYSTALPTPVVAAAQAALTAAAAEPERAAALWERVRQLQRLTGLECTSPIVAIHIGDEQKALDAAAGLLLRGFHVPAIRPPTVPPVRPMAVRQGCSRCNAHPVKHASA
jgi:8-amino-7-oxononanoate synthase